MKQNIPETSKEAYRSLTAKELNDTYKQILYALSVLGEATFEEVSAFARCSPAKIWKRLSELQKMDLIYRPGNKRMLKSGRNGFTWMLTNPPKTDEQQWQTFHGVEMVKPIQSPPSYLQPNLFGI